MNSEIDDCTARQTSIAGVEHGAARGRYCNAARSKRETRVGDLTTETGQTDLVKPCNDIVHK